jgi:aspartate aminotransferase-like enzyme
VLTVPVPGPLLTEIALRALVEHRALVLVSGPDGEALARTAEALGKEVLRLMVRPGEVVEPAHLARFLSSPPVDSVVLAHADFGAGTLAPLAELARVVRARRELLLLVEASGSLGTTAVETDGWGLDCVVAQGDRGLGLAPGLSFAAVSRRALARARAEPGRGEQLDLVLQQAAASRGQVVGEVPASVAAALDERLRLITEVEGMEARWARHGALRRLVDEWAQRHPSIRLLGTAGRRAPGYSCLELASDKAAGAAIAALAARGMDWADGIPADPRRLRLRHMGEVQPGELTSALELLATPP